MNWANVVMDVVLMGLLVAALLFGMRLDKRLKALRAAHEGFAKAVAELDSAAIRAHQSLKDLRSHADDSQELLHGRILAGRELIQKLETQVARAEKAQIAIEKGLNDFAILGARQVQAQAEPVTIRPEPTRAAEPIRFDASGIGADRYSPLREAMRARQQPIVAPEPEDEPDYNPAWSSKAAKQPAPRGTHAAFARDIIPAEDAQPPRAPRNRVEEEAAHAEMLDKVQMSELVVANLNEMIRSFSSPGSSPVQAPAPRAEARPVRRATLEDDLFGADAPRKR